MSGPFVSSVQEPGAGTFTSMAWLAAAQLALTTEQGWLVVMLDATPRFKLQVGP